MERYEVFCTPEQTVRAIQLGAPIKWSYDRFEDDAFSPINAPGVERMYAIVPTTTQMIGWLESKKVLKNFCVEKDYNFGDERYLETYCWSVIFNNTCFFSEDCYETRQEATLAAIDAALDYLIKK